MKSTCLKGLVERSVLSPRKETTSGEMLIDWWVGQLPCAVGRSICETIKDSSAPLIVRGSAGAQIIHDQWA
jgi:hypothetical protein